MRMLASDPRHGTTRGFHAGCRCEPCRAARARYEKQSRWIRHNGGRRSVPVIGAQRRIQALMALGWTSEDIRQAAGWRHRNYVLRILEGQKGKPCRWLERHTHDTICAVFDQLCMVLPPDSPYRRRSATIARNKGYLPPLAWDDIDNDPAPADALTISQGRGNYRTTLEDFDDLVRLGETPEIAAQRLGVQLDSIEIARRRAQRKVA